MVKKITIADNEQILRQRSKEVDFSQTGLLKEIAEFVQACKEETGVFAMASVQYGIPKRMVYVKHTDLGGDGKDENNHILMINPEILSQKGKAYFWEACASGLDNCAWVARPYQMEVKYCDIKGNVHIDMFTGLASTILSHELDHLDGILHMDRAEKLIHATREERSNLRKVEPYKVISKDCDFSYPPIDKTK